MASENKKGGGTFVGLALIPILFIPTLLINLFFPVALQPLQPLLCMDASAHLYSVYETGQITPGEWWMTITHYCVSEQGGTRELHDLYVMGFMAVFLIVIWLILMALVKRRMRKSQMNSGSLGYQSPNHGREYDPELAELETLEREEAGTWTDGTSAWGSQPNGTSAWGPRN